MSCVLNNFISVSGSPMVNVGNEEKRATSLC